MLIPVIFTLFFAPAQAQDDLLLSETIENPAALSAISLPSNFNAEDFIIGIGYRRLLFEKQQVSALASFSGRPYAKSVLEKASKDMYYLFREYRYYLLLGLEKKYALQQRLDIFANAMTGASASYYRGSRRDHWRFTLPVLTAGLEWKLGAPDDAYFSVQAAYQYINPDAHGHRVYTALLFSF
jgi:hypothetical protein